MSNDADALFRVVIEKEHLHAAQPEVAYRGPYDSEATAKALATSARNQGARYGVPTTATVQRLTGVWESIDPAEEATE